MYLIHTVIICILTVFVTGLAKPFRTIWAYLLFFSTTGLAYFGFLGVLTGFNPGYSSFFFGVSFLTPSLAYLVLTYPEQIHNNPLKFILSASNPIYQFTGPFPNSIPQFDIRQILRRFIRRVSVIQRDFIVGVFFTFIIAHNLGQMMSLKRSTNLYDIISFGILAEFYVYFNFCGFSMIAWSLMRLFGIYVPRNFNQPFSSTSLVDYWKRWHISFSFILRNLFFKPLKDKFNIYAAVLMTFIASALWHGASFNFLLWGIFHGTAWCISRLIFNLNFPKILNVLLLIFAVIFGRILSTELDQSVLYKKINAIALLDFKGEPDVLFMFNGMGMSNKVCLVFTAIIILSEMLLPRLGFKHSNYEHLKHPKVSIFILFLIVIFFEGTGVHPFYGNR